MVTQLLLRSIHQKYLVLPKGIMRILLGDRVKAKVMKIRLVPPLLALTFKCFKTTGDESPPVVDDSHTVKKVDCHDGEMCNSDADGQEVDGDGDGDDKKFLIDSELDENNDENNDNDASADAQEEEELLLWPSCGDTPCIWNELGLEVIAVGINHAWLEIDNQMHDFDVHVFKSMDDQQLADIHLEHKHCHHVSYTTFNKTWMEGGRGRGNRKRVPKCCEEKIHLMYPVPPGYKQTGFRSSSK